jgi:hypothetical protein
MTVPDRLTAFALLLLAEIEEQRGDRAAALSALEGAAEHARLGRWEPVEAGVLELRALIEQGPDAGRWLARARELEPTPHATARQHAIASLVAATAGDTALACAELEAARAATASLALSPEADALRWIRRAEGAL